MARTYSSPTFGGHRMVRIGPSEDLTTATNADAAEIASVRFKHPCKVVGWNLTFITQATDLTACTGWTIGRRPTGATSTACTAFGTADCLGETATHTEGMIIDGTCSETSFDAGDDCVIEVEGENMQAQLMVKADVEVVETFQEADS